MDRNEIYDHVNKWYGAITHRSTGQYEHAVAKAFGYTEEELASIPEAANLGLSCGNPIALGRLREGETVIDLGSGAGFDVFTAARKVGSTGRAIGVDMNKTMIDKANDNKSRTKTSNVEFIESAITSIALPEKTADCIISNCVINLVPSEDKQLAFNEMFRLLKPGGRVAISDILARKELTDEMKHNISLYVGCIAGASQVDEYQACLRNAGFHDILIVDSRKDLNVYYTAAEGNHSSCGGDLPKETLSCCTKEAKKSCCRPEDKESCCGTGMSMCACRGKQISMAGQAKSLANRLDIQDLNEWAGAFQVYAVKPVAD